MKKIMLSLGVIAIVAVGAIGATRAYFTSTATVSGNTFTSGSMALKIDSDASSSTKTWTDGFTGGTFTNLYPGYTMTQIIDVKNVGGIASNVTFDLNRTSGWSDLAGVLNFHVYYDAKNTGSWTDTGLTGTADAFTGPYNLGPITSSDSTDGSTPFTGKNASVKIVWSVPTSAGNEIMGDSETVNAVFGLEQVH